VSVNALSNAMNPSAGLGLLGTLTRQYAAKEEVEAEAKRELEDPIAFLQKTYPNESLWRFVMTHPDLDHMRGIKRLYETVGFTNFWDTKNTKPTPNFWGADDKADWEFYQAIRSGQSGAKLLNYTRGDSLYAFGQDENGQPGGDNIEILSPTNELVATCNRAGKSNSLSLVLRVSHAGKSILLPGDAEEDAWDIMVARYGQSLKSDFLKAPHHGRDSAYHLKALQLICPKITFVSVGRKPDTDASSKYRQQSGRVASTRYHGNIELRIHDDGSHEWFVERNAG
jgi:beta-lactamase superfamily II metal-dependent hydrolase